MKICFKIIETSTYRSKKLKFQVFCWLAIGQLCCLSPLFAVPKNNTCGAATYIKNVKNWCSSSAQYTNEGATDSGRNYPNCFTSGIERINDVWFKFRAIGNVASISVIGRIAGNPKGTMKQPQLVLYQGDCSDLEEVTCHSDARNYGISETFGYNMTIGATYYVRVDGRGLDMGTFQLCINNYNEVPSPSSDCSTGVILCDKSSFTVPSVIGSGKKFESLDGTCLIKEESSAWYKFTCDKAGSLTFTLKSVNPGDDIDFALFALPNGLDDCNLKVPLRCMASGENQGSYTSWSRCSGATGLKSSSSDITEAPGCDEFDDNFVAALGMKAGVSYALLIQNYHNTGNGFSVEFGGTGTFVGPKAWFKVSKLKIPKDSVMWARDVSTFPGGIAKWEWNFGEDASVKGAKRGGAHKFSYSKKGRKSIRLTVETKNGCRVTAVREITVIDAPPPPPPVEPEVAIETAKTPIPPEGNLTTSTIGTPPIIQKDTLIKPAPSSPVLEQIEAEDETFVTSTEDDKKVGIGKKATTRKIKKYWRIKRVGILYHPSDSFNIATEHMEVMNEMVGLLKATPTTIAYIEGHTNNIPHNTYCEELSEKRSIAAMNYLISKGIAADRLTNKIIGKGKPKDSNKSKYGRKRNQRVEIKILYPSDKITD